MTACASVYYAHAPGWTPTATLPAPTTEPGLSGADAAALTRYVATDVSLAQLAPRGWVCSLEVGADGSWTATVTDPTDANAMVVYAGAYNQPAIGFAVPWFPALCRLRVNPGTPCPTPPAGESVVRVSATLVRVTGAAGAADPELPASPRYPFVAAVALRGAGATPRVAPQPAEGVWCVVPPSQYALCARIVDSSVAGWTAGR